MYLLYNSEITCVYLLIAIRIAPNMPSFGTRVRFQFFWVLGNLAWCAGHAGSRGRIYIF